MSRYSNLKNFIYAEDDSLNTTKKDSQEGTVISVVSESLSNHNDSLQDTRELDCFSDIEENHTDARKVDVMELDVEPLKLNAIVDSSGLLSDRVDKFASDKGIAVVPFSAVGILSQVTQLQRHDVLELDGEKYAMLRTARPEVLEYYRNAVIKSISSGLVFSEKLMISIANGVDTIHTLKLSKIEWSYICAWFKDYNARVITSDEIRLVVG